MKRKNNEIEIMHINLCVETWKMINCLILKFKEKFEICSCDKKSQSIQQKLWCCVAFDDFKKRM